MSFDYQNKKLAIIGASTGQVPLYEKCRELGIYSIGIAWKDGAVAKDLASEFHDISIFDYPLIEELCRKEQINGIVSNCSDVTARSVSYLSTVLGLTGIKFPVFESIINKREMRRITNQIEGLAPVRYWTSLEEFYLSGALFPVIIKPVRGGGKKGVCFVNTEQDIDKAIRYAQNADNDDLFLIEEYITGREISVETLSYRNNHYVIQITDKQNSGVPHFVEIGHHQPASLDKSISHKIETASVNILKTIDITDGACHIEFKIKDSELYLIELNPRGGGDEISNKLVLLSTGFDYVKGIIDIALGGFNQDFTLNHVAFSGIYFLCGHTKHLLDVFKNPQKPDWIIESNVISEDLIDSISNYDRNGYLIYKSDHKIQL